ncbi:MAG: hypothetical protein JWN37_436 [Candidatus Nomurabacteria bacterium]|nr:hypothetical protein [Candidatus Nomurabacteria bacterium]
MNSYQLGVVALLVIFAGSIFYYINGTDSAGVLQSAVGKAEVTTQPIAIESVYGNYECNIDSGCKNPYTLSLIEDNSAIVTTSYNDGVEVRKESGSWKLEDDNSITILLNESNAGPYDTPHIITTKPAGKNLVSLTLAAYDRKFYDDMIKPLFIKR